MTSDPLIPHAIDREYAEKCRGARGWSTFHVWALANRNAISSFQSRMHIRGEQRRRLQQLINNLENEFKTLIQPFL